MDAQPSTAHITLHVMKVYGLLLDVLLKDMDGPVE